ncbi:hypothetical protein ACVXZ4_10060 [Lacisediminihabitans sp. FW035]
MSNGTGKGTSELKPQRYGADKLAVLCAERPALFVLVRVWASASVLLAASFVVDGLFFLIALVASNKFLLLLASGDLKSDEDRAMLTGAAAGLPFDLARLCALVFASSVLIVTELFGTRGLPSGELAMRESITNGLPWPGRWRQCANVARRLRPFALVIVGVACTCWIVFYSVFPLSVGSLIVSPLLLLLTIGGAWCVFHLARVGGRTLTNMLPSNIGVTSNSTTDAERAVQESDFEEAGQRRPAYPPLRLQSAVRVFQSPPLPTRRTDRIRRAWWSDSQTSIESFATELVFQAMIEARDRGLLVVSDLHLRNPHAVAALPEFRQPVGLGALVAGYHREGRTEGRVVDGRLSDMLSTVYDVDPYAHVIGIALDDLRFAGIAVEDAEVWRLSSDRLAEVVLVDSETAATTQTIPELSRDDAVRLRQNIARILRHRRITDAQSGTLLLMLDGVFRMAVETRRRRRYDLPQPEVNAQGASSGLDFGG